MQHSPKIFCNFCQKVLAKNTLVETAKANGLNMYHYLWYLLEELPQTDLSEEAFEKYLPWNPEVKTALEEKAQKLLED